MQDRQGAEEELPKTFDRMNRIGRMRDVERQPSWVLFLRSTILFILFILSILPTSVFLASVSL
jgi:hypothetical protein